MSKQLSPNKLMQMATFATQHEQQSKQQSLFTPVLTGAIAASIIGVIALTSAHYSTQSTVSDYGEEMVDLIVYESFESDLF